MNNFLRHCWVPFQEGDKSLFVFIWQKHTVVFIVEKTNVCVFFLPLLDADGGKCIHQNYFIKLIKIFPGWF